MKANTLVLDAKVTREVFSTEKFASANVEARTGDRDRVFLDAVSFA